MRINVKVEVKGVRDFDAAYLRKGITNVLKIGAEQIRRKYTFFLLCAYEI